MATSRELPFPLVMMCLVLIRGSSPLATASEPTGTHPVGSLEPEVFSTEDYSQYEYTDAVLPSKTPGVVDLKRCDYKPCLENQTPCLILAASTRCSCPGFTPDSQAPETPYLRSVAWNGSEVWIQWCAPSSYVTGYVATVGGRERQTFKENQRSGGVGGVDHLSQVCVMAVNEAGQSAGSCMMYESRDLSLPLKAGLIGGALGLLLLLLLLVVLLRRRRRNRKQQASISLAETQ